MPLTTLDHVAALVVIDLQKGVVSLPTWHPAGEIVSRSFEVARAFRERDWPVVLVNVSAAAPGRKDVGPSHFVFPDGWAELVPELEQQASDYVVTKQRPGAFIGTKLDDYLRERGVTQIFLTGIATSSGVEATGRSAFDYGYNVVFVVDAMTDRDEEMHRHCVERVFPRLGETETVGNVLRALGAG